MIRFVMRKMLHNKWLFLCLTLGSVFVTALISSIPIYTDGILQRMLIKDLENYGEQYGKYPGELDIQWQLSYNIDPKYRMEKFEEFDDTIIPRFIDEIDMPILSRKEKLTAANTSIYADRRLDSKGKPLKISAEVVGIQGIEDQIEITHGRMFQNQGEDDCIEVIVSKNALKNLNVLLDEEYILYSLLDSKNRDEALEKGDFYKLKIVGVYEMKDNGDYYWQVGRTNLDSLFILPYEVLKESILREHNNWIKSAEWSVAYDYHTLTIDQVEGIYETWKEQERFLKETNYSITLKANAAQIIEDYAVRRENLLLMMWILIIPVIMMLIFYIFMISQLIVMNDKNEITQLKSRGASKGQIFLIYFIESILISAVAMIIGPILGLYICKLLGLANGFLEFIGRKALPVHLDWQIYQYAIVSQLIFIASMLIPSMIYSRVSIVEHKRNDSKKKGKSFWKKIYIDIIFLTLSAYGIYQYTRQQEILKLTNLEGSKIGIDPIIFVVSTLFIVGASLFFLRLYPILIKMIFKLGKKKWNAVWYASFTNVGRIGGQEQFIMLFMMMAIAIGIMNANQARTLNQNLEDKVRYNLGADVVIEPKWVNLNNQESMSIGGFVQMQEVSKKEPRYKEPPFSQYADLEGVENATKVLIDSKSSLKIYGDRKNSNMSVMGIDTYRFGNTLWFKDGLLPAHINKYLNLIAGEPTAVLVSSNIKEEFDVKLGDVINITLSNGATVDGVIDQFIDYWPTFNPRVGDKDTNQTLIVANYQYLYNKAGVIPYQIWLDKKDDVTDKQLLEEIESKGFDMEAISFSDNKTIEIKNDPFNMGMNGILTLGFIVIMIVTTIGFIIYWILSIKGRTLQFGVLRALGLKQNEVFAIIGVEQVLISVVSIMMGIVIGGIGSDLFVPLIQLVSSAKEQVPPFMVTALREDYYKIYMITAMMLIVGTAIVLGLMRKIKISQALKLGED